MSGPSPLTTSQPLFPSHTISSSSTPLHHPQPPALFASTPLRVPSSPSPNNIVQQQATSSPRAEANRPTSPYTTHISTTTPTLPNHTSTLAKLVNGDASTTNAIPNNGTNTSQDNERHRSTSPSQRFLMSSSNRNARARERSTSLANGIEQKSGVMESPSNQMNGLGIRNSTTPGASSASSALKNIVPKERDVGMGSSYLSSPTKSPHALDGQANGNQLGDTPSDNDEEEITGDGSPNSKQITSANGVELGKEADIDIEGAESDGMEEQLEVEGDAEAGSGKDGVSAEEDDDEEEEEEEEEDEEEEEEDEEEDSDEDDDDDRSIGVESDDEPVFVSQRGPSGKMGLQDLVHPTSTSTTANVNGTTSAPPDSMIRVKAEPGEDSKLDASKVEHGMDVDRDLLDGTDSSNATRGVKRDAEGRIITEAAEGVDREGTAEQQANGTSVKRARLTTVSIGSSAEHATGAAPGQAEVFPGDVVMGDPNAPTASASIQPLAVDANGQPINVLVAKPKQRRKRAPSVEVVPPPPPIPRQTIRIEVNFRPAAGDEEAPTGTTFHSVGMHNFYKTINFKEESVRSGVVEEAYWNPPMLVGADADAGSDKESGDDEDMEDGGKVKKGKGKAAAPPPMSLADLMLSTEGGDEADMARLAAELEAKYETKPTRKRRAKADIYDSTDPFIDDTELKIDEPEFYQQPKKPGFFVQKGPIELMQETPKKPVRAKGEGGAAGGKNKLTALGALGGALKDATKKKKTLNLTGMGRRPNATVLKARDVSSAAGPSSTRPVVPIATAWAAVGDSMIATSDGNGRHGSISYSERAEGSPEIEIVGEVSVAPAQLAPTTVDEALARLPETVAARLRDLRNMNQAESWVNKKAFPESLVAPALRAGESAIEAGVFGDRYFDALPFCINYNRFTMKKWSLGKLETFHHEHAARKEQELLQELQDEIDAMMPPMIDEYDDLHRTWQMTMQEYNAAVHNAIDPVTGLVTQEIASTLNAPKEPQRRFRWTPQTKDLFWRTVKVRDEGTEYAKMQAEVRKDAKSAPAGQAARTKLYNHLVKNVFPDGWMSTSVLSREMSQIKKRQEG